MDSLEIESVVFDFDRTLVDLKIWTETDYLSSRREVVDIYLDNGVSSSLTRKHMTPLRLFSAVSAESETDMTEEEYDRVQDKVSEMIRERFEEKCLEVAVCLDGAPEVLRWLDEEGLDVGIVSLNSETVIEEILGMKGLEEYVDVVFGRRSPGRPKPYPDQIQSCMTRFDSDPETTLMVGDGPSDIEAARRAGVTPVALVYDYYSKEELRDSGASRVIESLADLKDIITDAT